MWKEGPVGAIMLRLLRLFLGLVAVAAPMSAALKASSRKPFQLCFLQKKIIKCNGHDGLSLMASVRNVSSCIMEAKNRYKGLSVEARLSCRWALVSGQCTYLTSS